MRKKSQLCLVCPQAGAGRPTVAEQEEEQLPDCCWAGRKPASLDVSENELGRGFHTGMTSEDF